MTRFSLVCALMVFPAFGQQPAGSLADAIRKDDLKALKQQLAHSAAPVNAPGFQGTTPLMLASAFGSRDAMRLLVEHGAGVNAHNDFGATALMWCVYDVGRMQLLLDRGANVNAVTKSGESALLIASNQPFGAAAAKLLLARGANLQVVDKSGNNPLLAAADANNAELVRLYLDRGLNPNSSDEEGGTPLEFAARNGNTAMAALLLRHGAEVNQVSAKPTFRVKNGIVNLGLLTPLIAASTDGPTDLVKLLLDAGASVNARDARGATPLILSVTSERQDPETVRLLLARGADPALKMETGETARDWALKFQRPEVMALLAPAAPASVHSANAASPVRERNPSQAAAAGLAIMEKVSGSFLATGGCVSCHAQNITAIAEKAARDNGIPVSPTASRDRLRLLNALWGGQMNALLERLDPPGNVDTTGHTLFEFMAEGQDSSDTTSAMVHNLAAQQRDDGSWSEGGVARAPIEDGDTSRTAMALRALKALGPPGRRVEFADRIGRARRWLLSVQPRYIDESDFQLLGLKWSGAEDAEISPFTKKLLALQRPDGGWAQNPYLESDAYATGQALYALHEGAGLPQNDAAYERGVQFLLKTQSEDGSWHVRSRAVKFQPYFESGFPHGQDQWISQMATGWATAALALAGPKPEGPATIAQRIATERPPD